MSGICGWIPAGTGRERSLDPAACERAMRGALAHRGAVGWLGPPETDGGAGARFIVDSSFNDPGALSAAWDASRA